jgi:hypothetical protein
MNNNTSNYNNNNNNNNFSLPLLSLQNNYSEKRRSRREINEMKAKKNVGVAEDYNGDDDSIEVIGEKKINNNNNNNNSKNSNSNIPPLPPELRRSKRIRKMRSIKGGMEIENEEIMTNNVAVNSNNNRDSNNNYDNKNNNGRARYATRSSSSEIISFPLPEYNRKRVVRKTKKNMEVCDSGDDEGEGNNEENNEKQLERAGNNNDSNNSNYNNSYNNNSINKIDYDNNHINNPLPNSPTDKKAVEAGNNPVPTARLRLPRPPKVPLQMSM